MEDKKSRAISAKLISLVSNPDMALLERLVSISADIKGHAANQPVTMKRYGLHGDVNQEEKALSSSLSTNAHTLTKHAEMHYGRWIEGATLDQEGRHCRGLDLADHFSHFASSNLMKEINFILSLTVLTLSMQIRPIHFMLVTSIITSKL